MQIVRAYEGGCGELLDMARLQQRCTAVAPGHWHTMYFECIILVGLLEAHPNATIWDNRMTSYKVAGHVATGHHHCAEHGTKACV